MRKLYLFGGSPYARKVRILLEELGLAYEVEAFDGYPLPETIAQVNPNLMIPALIDGDLKLFESGLIATYLLETYRPNSAPENLPPLAAAVDRAAHRWEDAKTLATLDSMTGSMVQLAYLHWCGMEATGPNLVGMDLKARHELRVHSCLDWLEERATAEGFIPGVFSLQDIALICALAWTDARLRFPWRGRPTLEALVAYHAARPSIMATLPPPWTPPGTETT